MAAKFAKWLLVALLPPSLAQAGQVSGPADLFELAKQNFAAATAELELALAQCQAAEQVVDLPRADTIPASKQDLLLAVNYHNTRLKNECSGDALRSFYVAGQIVRTLMPPEAESDLPGFELVDDALEYWIGEIRAKAQYHDAVSPERRAAIEAQLSGVTAPFDMILSWEKSGN